MPQLSTLLQGYLRLIQVTPYVNISFVNFQATGMKLNSHSWGKDDIQHWGRINMGSRMKELEVRRIIRFSLCFAPIHSSTNAKLQTLSMMIA